MTDRTPKIVLLDIENSPLTIYAWQTYDANALKVLERSKIISVAWKDLGSNECSVKAICDFKGYKPGVVDESKLVHEIWHVLDEADIVICHNLKFDVKKLNAAFVMNGLSAPSEYQTICTLVQAKKFFRFDSNNLNALGQYLNVGQKVHTGGFDLWSNCIAGDATAWATMKEYNIQDVLLLEKVYLRLRPFMSRHPDLNLVAETDDMHCSACLSTDLQKRGYSHTKTTRKQRYQCNTCHSWSSGSAERIKKT